jgi:hypothetical protein
MPMEGGGKDRILLDRNLQNHSPTIRKKGTSVREREGREKERERESEENGPI